MSRTLSPVATASAAAPDTAEVWLELITIDHASLSTPLRYVNNNAAITSNGHVYEAWPFKLTRPGEDAENPTSATLKIGNVDQRLMAAMRSISGAPTCAIQVVLASQPNTVEMEVAGLRLRSVSHDAQWLTFTLSPEEIWQEPVATTLTPQMFPGLF